MQQNYVYFLYENNIYKVLDDDNVTESSISTDITLEEALNFIDVYLEKKYKNSRDSKENLYGAGGEHSSVMRVYLKGIDKKNFTDKLKHPLKALKYKDSIEKSYDKKSKKLVKPEELKNRKGISGMIGGEFTTNGERKHIVKKGAKAIQKERDKADDVAFKDAYKEEIKTNNEYINSLKEKLSKLKKAKDEKGIEETKKKIEIVQRNLNNRNALLIPPSNKPSTTKGTIPVTKPSTKPATV